jgi:hypothetical protein
MIRTKLATLVAVCLAASNAMAADDVPPAQFPVDDLCRVTANCDYEIRERLLSIPVWHFEWTRAQRTQGGLVRFEMRGNKLIGNIDAGVKCDNEIVFVEGGFMMDTCPMTAARKFVQVDDTYQCFCGTYILTIRPPR